MPKEILEREIDDTIGGFDVVCKPIELDVQAKLLGDFALEAGLGRLVVGLLGL